MSKYLLFLDDPQGVFDDAAAVREEITDLVDACTMGQARVTDAWPEKVQAIVGVALVTVQMTPDDYDRFLTRDV